MAQERSDRQEERREARAQLFRDILERRALTCVFQPILSFHERRIYGYEALIRGPKASIFQSPVELFSAAEDDGSLAQLSVICVNTVLREFATCRLPGKLFLNISPHVVATPGFDRDRALKALAQLQLKADQVIIELTEHQPTFNFAEFQRALTAYRSMGFQVAIDDLGEGFSSLRLWSELRPEFVKADKHFVTGIADDAVKMQFLKAMQQIAESCGTSLIAEGIESESDFKMVRDLGVACGQGYLIGRPTEKPSTALSSQVLSLLGDLRVPVPPTPRFRQVSLGTAEQFLRDTVSVAPHVPVRDVIRLFEASHSRFAIPVVEGGAPIGLIARRHVRYIKTITDVNASDYAKSAREIMNAAPMIVDRAVPLMRLAGMLSDATPQHLADGFIIVEDGKFLGMGAVTDLMRVLTDAHLTAARYTNPLTFLPGPVPIHMHVERLLERAMPFTACLVEIDPMKGFNDALGFSRGDELIRIAGETLLRALDERHDFVGHLDGNRFALLLQSDNWQSQLQSALVDFRTRMLAMLSDEVVARGSFVWRGRSGATEIRPFPRMIIGAADIGGTGFDSRHEVMTVARDALSRAKSLPATPLFHLSLAVQNGGLAA